MGRQTKAAQARIQNLRNNSASQQSSEPLHNTLSSQEHTAIFSVLEDDESESASDYTPSDSDDFDSADEDEYDVEGDIQNDADLLRFSSILVELQAVAVKMEAKKAEFKPRRTKHYTGNSQRTKRFHAQKRHTISAKGQKFISHFFQKQEIERLTHQLSDSTNLDSSSDSDSDTDELGTSLINVDEHIQQIFSSTIEQINTEECLSITVSQ
jgi:hypothetical protein